MTQEQTQPTATINATENTKLQQFLSKNEIYIEPNPETRGSNVYVYVNARGTKDRRTLDELKIEASKYGGAFTISPKAAFISPTIAISVPTGFTLKYLYPQNIEGGGPQPRGNIDPQDHETIALYESIKMKGQLVPIQTYPSPMKNGNSRIYEGNRRHMVIFVMLMGKCPSGPGIWTLEANISEAEAYEYAFTINYKRKSLSAFELGGYLVELTKKFPDVYKTNVHGFSFQENVGKRLGLDDSRISQIFSAYNEIVEVSKRVAPELFDPVRKLSERITREAKKLPDEVKPQAYTEIITNEFNTTDTKRYVEKVNAIDEPTPEKVTEAAKQVVEEKAQTPEERAKQRVQEIATQDIKLEKKMDRQRQKLIDEASGYPESLMKAIYGHFSVMDKRIPADKAKGLAFDVVDLLVQRAIADKTIDVVINEAESWN